MSDFDVQSNDMDTRRLSDADAEDLMAGRPAVGAPPRLVVMFSTMRHRAETGPGVAPSAALREFVVDGSAPTNPVDAAAPPTPSRARSRRSSQARRAAAMLAVVPAKLLIGASMAAAAVGGAQAFGVVDLPLLPSPASHVVTTTVPVEIVPRPVDAPSPPTLPAQARVEGSPGCEFSQDNAAQPDVTRPTVLPSIDPCASDAHVDIDAPPRTPIEPEPWSREPAAVPDDDRDQPAIETPDQAVDGNAGHEGDDSRSDAPVPAPDAEHDDGSGPDDAARESIEHE